MRNKIPFVVHNVTFGSSFRSHYSGENLLRKFFLSLLVRGVSIFRVRKRDITERTLRVLPNSFY